MDEIDRKILKLLKENARRSYVEIGNMVGLTEGAVRRRVKKLIDEGRILRFTIEVKDEVEGIILIKTHPSRTKDVTRKVREFSSKVFEVSGEFDIAVLLSASTMDEINGVVDEIRRIPAVINTNTLIKLVE
ncbi:Lrp/AsnC family transcriptional regulator [Candidatus Bathyarchaeota archaeon]|nr:Lrp/AsnC family transcriptional regulator [Candidatus Bathyarchaeota archaeon]